MTATAALFPEKKEIVISIEKRSLAGKLADVMAECHRIPKRGRNEFHKYDYATESDIVEVVRVELAKRSVMLIPAVVRQTREAVGEKGSVLTTLDMTFTFYDGDSGDTIERTWIGAGTDKEDKGAYKAMTGATKYFLLKTFLLATGDDPEQDEKPQRGKAAQPPPTKPEGYDDWIADMSSAADEGAIRFNEAWAKSKVEYRRYLTDTDVSTFGVMKAKAKAKGGKS